MFCEHCGRQIRDEAYMCPYCGILVKRLPERGPSKQPENTAAAEPAPRSANGLAIAGFTVSIVGAFCMFAGFVLSGFARAGDFLLLGLMGVLVAFGLSLGALLSMRKKRGKKGLAIAGLVISAATFGFLLLLFLLAMLFGGMYLSFLLLLAGIFSGGGVM